MTSIRRLLPVLFSMFALAFMAGCGESSDDSSGSATTVSGFDDGAVADEALDDGGSDGTTQTVSAGEVDQPSAAAASAALEVGAESTDPNAKIIFESDVVLEADDVAEAANEVASIAVDHGGFVAAQNVQLGATGRATMTIRVPVDRFTNALNEVRRMGNAVQVNTSTSDVSLEFVDIVAKIKTQEASIARVTELLAGAGSTDQILRLERELAERQGEVDALTGRKNYLDNRVRLSTVRVEILEKGKAPEVAVIGDETEQAGPGFSDGLGAGADAFVAVSSVVLVMVGAALPFLPFVVVGALAWRIVRARSKRDTVMVAAPGPGPSAPPPGPGQQPGPF